MSGGDYTRHLSDGHNSPYVLLRAVYVQKPYERATYGLRESNFTILTCNCCTDSARSTCVPRTVLASSVLTPHFPVDLLNDHAEHTCTILVYKDDLTGDCQLVSKMPRKAQKKSTRQDPKKRAAEDTRAASDDEVNRRCTHLQRASTACTRQRSNRTEIVRCKHVQLTYHLRNVRCTQPLTARRVVQTTKNVADVATTKTYGQKARTASCDRGFSFTQPLMINPRLTATTCSPQNPFRAAPRSSRPPASSEQLNARFSSTNLCRCCLYSVQTSIKVKARVLECGGRATLERAPRRRPRHVRTARASQTR
ncbi:hypothetical protein Bbelb_324310 [Branchiostoma belcheri]|nr:hypothetical protein Bbelb_324310 [Branchiostoma belcheri]